MSSLLGLFRRREKISDRAALCRFIDGSSAYVAQTTLYGYIKTRAGFQYFRLFDDAVFVASVNIAKWNIYAACVGDLAAFCAAHLRRHGGEEAALADFISACVTDIFASHGTPADASADYPPLAQKARLRAADFAATTDDETAFLQSPRALLHWAPIADKHKKYDAEVVKNSMIFKWKEVRADFRRRAQPAPMLAQLAATG